MKQTLNAWAARIRPHFPSELQGTAEVAAYWFATVIGSQVKGLRPEASMATVLSWLKSAPRGILAAAWVEILMAIEEDASGAITDAFAETIESRTFGEFVRHLSAQARICKSH